MYYVGIDPGTQRMGVAIKKADQWIDSTVFVAKGPNPRERYLQIAEEAIGWVHQVVANDAGEHLPRIYLGIEDQFVFKDAPAALILKECSGAVAALAHSQLCVPAGWIYFVNPSTWQHDLLGRRPGMKSAEIKATTARVAASLFGKPVSDIGKDEADAICIAHYLQSVVVMGGAVDGKLLRRSSTKGARARRRGVKAGARARVVSG